MNETVARLWPELEWIKDHDLREKTAAVWEYALEQSQLTAEDLERIPFSLLIADANITFMQHKRTCVQLAVDIAKRMEQNFGPVAKVDMDILVAGAILIDVGKLLEYALENGKLTTSRAGKLVRHPFSGVALAQRFDLPPEVLHIIGTHSKEGDLGKRTLEAWIVHYADFVTFEPFRPNNRL